MGGHPTHRLVNFRLTPEDEARIAAIRDKTLAANATAALRKALVLACRTLGIEKEVR